MICPKCGSETGENLIECMRCGIVFSKYYTLHSAHSVPTPTSTPAQTRAFTFRDFFWPVVHEEVDPIALAGRILLLTLLALWSLKFVFSTVESNYAGASFMHLVNLPFHEAGHIIFSPLGRFIAVLGGTMGQLFMPAICLVVLLIRTRDVFGAAVAQWWLAESFMDIAPYINDARDLNLILLGGVTGREVADYHDWEYILRHLGMLHLDHFLANLAQTVGIVLMIAALVWAASSILIQFVTWRNVASNRK
ncbi:MAG: hypothetical protein VR64_16475 [Desulfatitalea sp. BRH_c12]|nr:MAG: hypothetical protein VR64_16475 [Desulfatitalea sp. BRH_c12]